MNQHKNKIEDYELNDLNPGNTHESSLVVPLDVLGYEMAIGFWPQAHLGKLYPFSALIAYVDGWEVISQYQTRWNDPDTPEDEHAEDIGAFRDPEVELAAMINTFNKHLLPWLDAKPGIDVKALPWEILLDMCDRVHFVNKLVIDEPED